MDCTRGATVESMRRPIAAAALAVGLAVAPAAHAYTIEGRGYGHGVGLSQWGAYGLAKHGRTYRQILTHYYSGTNVGRAPGRRIRVLLETRQAEVAFAGALFAGSTRLRPDRTYRARLNADGTIVVRRTDGKRVGTFAAPLTVSPANEALRIGGTALNGVTDGAYRGALELRPSIGGGGLTAIDEPSLEGYVRGVVPGEVPATWPAEALKAQAVAARSYALTTDAGGAIFDQYPDTRSQVYKGLDGEQPRTNGAVAATAGEVVRYRGAIATTYFFSASGGRTENVENSFYGSAPLPYLRSVNDRFDFYAPRHTWTVNYTLQQLAARLHGLVKGGFRGIRVVERGASPRVVSADVVGADGSTRVTGATLKLRLGLPDSWAYFPEFGSRAERAVAAQPVPLPISVGGPSRPPPPPVRAPLSGWPAELWRVRGA